MEKRYVSIWFRHLLADWQVLRRPELKTLPFVFAAPDHGRSIITAVNELAAAAGIEVGMKAADAKAICMGLEVLDDKPGRAAKLIKGLAEYCIRYSPVVMLDEFSTEGLFMDSSGCSHLWGGEKEYLKEIFSRFKSKGYTVRLGMADTIGAAWAISRYGKVSPLIMPGMHTEAMLPLPPDALRLEESTLAKLRKLGFYQIKSFIGMPRSVLRRRFGEDFLTRLGQALGSTDEPLQPVQVPLPYQERLPCLELIRTRAGIELAISKLLEQICLKLQNDQKGLRTAQVSSYRIDGKVQQISIGTNSPTHSVSHLLKLFTLKIEQIRPGLGIELFILDAAKVEELNPGQEALWNAKPGLDDQSVIQLLDRVAGKVGPQVIRRFLPDTHYWPERSIKASDSLSEKIENTWRTDKPRPTELLHHPEPIEVMALIPDHPPKFFIYRGTKHEVSKADGPERIEREWWMDEGEHRDYYQVEDEKGQRYWLYRSGHYYDERQYKWFIHGFFA